MITSIKIGKGFSKFIPRQTDREPGIIGLLCEHRYYPVDVFPEGHVLDTSSPLVVIIGDNGTGKSTLLQRISSHDIEATCDTCDTYNVGLVFGYLKQPVLPGYSTGQISEEMIMSQGTYKLHCLEEKLKMYETGCGVDVLLLDQPEDFISLRNKRRVIERITKLAFEKGVQVFVATHDERFLGISGSRIINLDERPARSYNASDFDVNKYMI
ncbi:MAG: ABC transporter ATP-binding protein [Candidatus Woesearchaeota archaeon]|jgi:predicted ATPase